MIKNESASIAGNATDQKALDWLTRALGLDSSELPFPWQVELLRRFRQGKIVSSIDLPTGLGKTAVIAVWLVARALGASLPRRLIYVVDRRAVVDQATDVAETLCEWVATEPGAADALGLADRLLPISTLRGQYVDNRKWLEDPSSPAIVLGTVDMVGSRLLFSGYGVSSKMRPFHAALLGVDSLVVLDEAHLVPAFEDLLRQVERGADSFGPKDASLRALVPPFRLLSLSATGRQTDDFTLTLSEGDRRDPIVKKRLNAKKTLIAVEMANVAKSTQTPRDTKDIDEADEATKNNKGPKLAGVLAKQAWEVTAQGAAKVRCLVFCNSRKDAIDVAAELHNLAKSTKLPEPPIELFVGGRRVKERTQARDALAHLGFLAGGAVNLDHSAFLIATSAGEVGVDLDADHMVCDLVAWERMVQRLGRVNRRGDGDAKVVVVIASEPEPSDGTTKAIEKRNTSYTAKSQLDELTKKLSTLQSKRTPAPKGRKKSADDTAAEQQRKQAEKDLKQLISACQKRIKLFKDADAKVAARHEAAAAQYRALRKLLTAVGEGGSLNPNALLTLRDRRDVADFLRDATTSEPLRPELTRPLVDAWSMTSLDEHPGRPEVDPWLRGFRPNDPPQTTVVWRRHLPLRTDGPFDAKAAKQFFEAAPIHTSEQLETETHLVLAWLVDRATAMSPARSEEALLDAQKVVVIALGERGEPKGWLTLNQIAAAKGKGKNENKEAKKAREQGLKELETLLVGATLVIDARLGGLNDGLLSAQTNTTAEASDDGSTIWLTRPHIADVPVTGFRIRLLNDSEEGDLAWRTMPGDGWVRRHLFVTNALGGKPTAALVVDGWAGDAATEEERAEANQPQHLEEHQSNTEDCARHIAQRLGIETSRADLIILAASLHDEGKRAVRWQRAFKAPIDGRHYAKTKGPIDFDLLDGYRHELGSLSYVEAHQGFKDLDTDDKDFVLHLIAAHHGFARPMIGTSGCDNAPPSMVEEHARAVSLRFSRLSRKWGPWGLAWWESLLRSADQTASRLKTQAATTQKERPS